MVGSAKLELAMLRVGQRDEQVMRLHLLKRYLWMQEMQDT